MFPIETVSVVGTGSVGGRLTRGLLARGVRVTLWNRSSAALDPLILAGAVTAETVNDVVRASSIVFISLTDYLAATSLFDSVDDRWLQDCLIVQMSGGSPDEAETFGQRILSRGGRYLDASLYSYPGALVDGTATMFVSGEERDFSRLKTRVFPESTWDFAHAGKELGAAKQLSNLLEAVNTLAVEGFLIGAALAETAGISVRNFADLLRPRLAHVLDQILDQSVDRIESGDHRGEMAVELWRHGLGRQIAEAEKAGVDVDALRVVARQMDRAVERGLGSQDISVLFEVIRHHEDALPPTPHTHPGL